MGIWTTFTGKITTHQGDNFSVKKALTEYYDGHDFTVSLFDSSRGINTVTQSFVFSVDNEIVVATKDFQMFLEQHKKQNKHFEVDVNVEHQIETHSPSVWVQSEGVSLITDLSLSKKT